MHMHFGEHHQSMRKRGVIPTVHRSKSVIYGVDSLAYIASLLSLFFTIDQIRVIWVQHDARGVSFLSWLFYTISSVVWFFYGIVHKDKAIIIINFIWFFFSLFILAGIALYS